MKRIISLILMLMMILSTVPSVFAEESTEEIFEYAVTLVTERLYYKRAIDCYPVDISAVANVGYADEVSGDGGGGWSDQGPTNDLSSFALRGTNYLFNIPFNFIEPNANNGKSLIMLRGQKDVDYPLEATVPVNDVAEGMYLIHAAPWAANNNVVGKYGYEYEDGTTSMFEIICGTHIADFWGQTENAFMRIAWNGSNPSSKNISLNLFALNNPHPEKKIKNLKFVSGGEKSYLGIVGVTIAKSGFCFPLAASASSDSLEATSINLWPKANPKPESSFEGSILDSSKYLDAPAGKHGIISAKGEDLYFADGTKAKLWGTNLVGEICFPDKVTAENIAARIARNGYNLVRFSNIDQQELTTERLDKLAYLQSLLKEKGIYSYFSLLGNRKGDGEDISDGWKIEGLFVDELIKEQQDFAKTLLTHQNKYTGMTLATDPSVVMIDLADQNTMFDYELGDDPLRTLITEETKEIITKKFNQFLKNKYKTTSALKKSWKVVYDDEKIEDGTVKINGNWKYGIYDAAHKKDVYEFLAYLQEQHYNALSETIRSTGYKGLISGVTNMWNNITPYNSYSQSKYADFLPVNGVGANGFESKKLREDMWYIDYDAIITGNSHSGNEFLDFAENRVLGVPYIISSWGTGFVSPTSYEAPVLMSVLASQQNWTPIQYCFAYDEISDDMFKDLYSTYSNPVQQALSHIAATLYYNTDELQKETIYNYNKDYLYVDKEYNGGTQPNIHRKPLHPDFKTLFTNKSNVTFYTTPSDLISKNVEKYETVNDNMYFDMIDGRFLAHNDKAIVYAGKNSRIEKYGRLEMDIFSQSGFVGLISADDKNIDESERMLLSVGGRVLNKDMEMNEIRIIKYGTAPMLYENIIGDITIKNASGYKVYALDESGKRTFELETISNEDGSLTFTVNEYYNAINYEIVKEGK